MLSIIIITKEEEKYLPKLLKSLKEQTYKNYEIIVADANSKDRTREIAKSFGCRVIEGGLPSEGRNKGAKVAKGNILLFLDADVVLPKDFLEKNLNEFIKKDLIGAAPLCLPLSERSIDKFLYQSYNNWAYLSQYIYPIAMGVCIFCQKNVFEKIGGFNEEILIGEDHDFAKRCKTKGKFRILRKIPIFCDIRRLEKEGRWNLIRKYLKAGAYRIFKKDIKGSPIEYELHGGVKINKTVENKPFKKIRESFKRITNNIKRIK